MGTRPEAIKMAPVIRALRHSEGLQPIVVSTGQHREMLRQVVDVFQIEVDYDLDLMQPNQTLASLSSRLIGEIDGMLGKCQPDLAMVQGDTTTVLMAALACFYRRIPIGHVEAGLRTGNIWSPFPEEANRVLASRLMSLHFPPTESGRENLLREDIQDSTITVTGNTVIDALFEEVARQDNDISVRAAVDAVVDPLLPFRWREESFVLITGHRRENFGDGFEEICRALSTLAERFPDRHWVYPVHLNPNVREPVYRCLDRFKNVHLIEPQDYRSFVALLQHCKLVITDSGGVQEEAPSLGKPVLVMRDTTERPEAVAAGTAMLVGAVADSIVKNASRLLTDPVAYRQMSEASNPYGDGTASQKIVERLRQHFGLYSSRDSIAIAEA